MASPASSVRFAPTRSATSPQTILPLSEARAATLSTVVAAITVMPWSIAWVTMWKIGPECAAQHAKWVSAMAANCGVRTTCPIVRSGPAAARGAGGARRGGGGVAHEEGGGTDHEPHEIADAPHRGAPVVGGDQPARDRRHHRRA